MREGKGIEFKEQVSDSFLKTVTAFSNYDGGKILFGVNEEGVYVGLSDLIEAKMTIENKINDSISPQVNFRLEIEENIIILHVESGEDPPYFYKSKSYKRNDTSTIPMDQLELKRLILKGQNRSFDSLTVDVEQASFTYLEEKFRELMGMKSLSSDSLKSLGLMNKKDEITNAGLLLSDENNYQLIDIVRFGKNQDVILNRARISHVSLLKAYDKAVEFYQQYYQYETIDSAYRTKHELIPEAAFREALANALVHRDWMKNSFVQISMEDKWITIVSPGALPEELTENDFLNGRISIMRNPIIGNVFYRLDIIEGFGTGIRRIKKAYAQSNKKPIFKVHDNYIEIRLPIITKLDNLSDNQKSVYYAIEKEDLASSEIAKVTGFGKNKVLILLEDLIEDGYVVKSGNGRGTKYSSKL